MLRSTLVQNLSVTVNAPIDELTFIYNYSKKYNTYIPSNIWSNPQGAVAVNWNGSFRERLFDGERCFGFKRISLSGDLALSAKRIV